MREVKDYYKEVPAESIQGLASVSTDTAKLLDKLKKKREQKPKPTAVTSTRG